MLGKKNLLLLISFGILLRILTIYYFGDAREHHEWVKIIVNLEQNNTFALREIDDVLVETIFMPPLYPFFLYVIKLILIDDSFFINTVFYIQLVISLLSTIAMYKILLNFFNDKLSKFGAILFYFFPLNVYSISQISSATLQIFLINIFFYYLLKTIKYYKFKDLFMFSIFSGGLILLRGEFFLIYFLTLIFFFIKKKSKFILISSLISLLITSPYLIRNYVVFDTIGITKSSGYNLWKGNNINSTIEGSDKITSKNLQEKISNIKVDSNYEIKLDQIFKEEAVNNIKKEPSRYFGLYVKKIFSFILFNPSSTYPNYYNLLHILPKICISILCLAGIYLSFSKDKKLNYFAYYYFFNIFLFSIFFILPRYSLALLPVQIIFTCYFLKNSKIKFFRSILQ